MGACGLFVGLCMCGCWGDVVFLLFLVVFSLCVSFGVVLWWGGLGSVGVLLVFLEDVLMGFFFVVFCL